MRAPLIQSGNWLYSSRFLQRATQSVRIQLPGTCPMRLRASATQPRTSRRWAKSGVPRTQIRSRNSMLRLKSQRSYSSSVALGAPPLLLLSRISRERPRRNISSISSYSAENPSGQVTSQSLKFLFTISMGGKLGINPQTDCPESMNQSILWV